MSDREEQPREGRREREKPPADIDRMHTLKIDNVTSDVTNEDLRNAFERFGEIGDIYIPRRYGSFDSRGFAFVRFIDERDADDALREMDGKLINGLHIQVQTARQKRPENPRQHMRRRGSSRDRRDRGRYDRRSRSRSGDRRDRRSRSRSRSRERRRSRDERSRSRSRGRY